MGVSGAMVTVREVVGVAGAMETVREVVGGRCHGNGEGGGGCIRCHGNGEGVVGVSGAMVTVRGW